MNKNIIIVLAGGFLVSILVALMVQAALNGSKKEQKLQESRVQILVAAKNLDVGHEIESTDLIWQEWPEANLFKGAVVRKDEQQPTDVVSGKLLRSLEEGQPVHKNVIIEEDKGEFLAANLQKGMRAVGIEVKKHVVADRLIKPGNFVDVLVTYRVRVNTKGNLEAQSIVNRYATETVIENIRVLAIDTNDKNVTDVVEEGDGKEKKSKAAKKAVVTLEVKPDEAEKLLLAYKMGDIGLSLRSIGDVEQPQGEKNVTDVGLSRVMTKLTKLTGGSSAVRIYSGANMTEARGRSDEKPATGVEFDVEGPISEPEVIMMDPLSLGGIE